MAYSSIIQKPCKCGCGSPPTLGFQGYNAACRPDIKAQKIKKHNAQQYQKGKLSKLVREQMQNGDHDGASVQALKNDCDFVFSRIVRMMGADLSGGCACYTCNVIKHWSMQQCGHFIKRANTQIRWDFRNAKPQCKYCNENLGGNLEVYEERLQLEQYGLPQELKELSVEAYKWGKDDLKGLLISLREKLRIIETKFKNTNT